ncbi:hypothetical protein GSI_06633 [Ganoderma sinense ZZ0214-1]|uniref:Uncharacterized protein n=1 Tax=Ganoderma sinense ZZ0214-1 TaxID=1077348 RepID=A0A2G8SDU4_9APHY|nr:hypothetical protein GSI_06633 [Ganoderma sinense ZZ0214-1]
MSTPTVLTSPDKANINVLEDDPQSKSDVRPSNPRRERREELGTEISVPGERDGGSDDDSDDDDDDDDDNFTPRGGTVPPTKEQPIGAQTRPARPTRPTTSTQKDLGAHAPAAQDPAATEDAGKSGQSGGCCQCNLM